MAGISKATFETLMEEVRAACRKAGLGFPIVEIISDWVPTGTNGEWETGEAVNGRIVLTVPMPK